MPEGPELHFAGLYVNKVCDGLRFGGKVEKSAVSKNPEVPFSCPEYTIRAVSRGKEVKLILMRGSDEADVACIVFRFGMSGSFKLTTEEELPKHAHLRFYTLDVPRQVLSFVDPRRFGSWVYNGTWQLERGPCVITEYDKFRENVLKHLSEKLFDKPICEVMLNQKYFNGIGNYLRSEILHRLKIPPFTPARAVLESVTNQSQVRACCASYEQMVALSEFKENPSSDGFCNGDLSLSKKIKIKKENPDFLQLCNSVPLEVIHLAEKGYNPAHTHEYTVLMQWMQCYNAPGMKSLRDSNGRTVWFQDEPGPLAPKGKKARNKRKSVDLKPVKVEPNATKRKSTRGKLTAVKKECKEVKVEEGEETAVKRKRAKMTENTTEDAKMRNKGEKVKRLPRVKKTVDPEVKVSRRQSHRSPMPKTPSRRAKAIKQEKEDVPSPKPRPRRLRSDVGNQPKDSPKLKPGKKRKSAVRAAEKKS